MVGAGDGDHALIQNFSQGCMHGGLSLWVQHSRDNSTLQGRSAVDIPRSSGSHGGPRHETRWGDASWPGLIRALFARHAGPRRSQRCDPAMLFSLRTRCGRACESLFQGPGLGHGEGGPSAQAILVQHGAGRDLRGQAARGAPSSARFATGVGDPRDKHSQGAGGVMDGSIAPQRLLRCPITRPFQRESSRPGQRLSRSPLSLRPPKHTRTRRSPSSARFLQLSEPTLVPMSIRAVTRL